MSNPENILLLHEAIAVVLLTKENKSAYLKDIAAEIERRNLYKKKDGGYPSVSQIRLRVSKSKGQYIHLFGFRNPDIVWLK